MCKLCETKPVYEFTNQRKLCKNCFVRWFQKKVLYTIRRFEMISKGDVVGYDVSGTQGGFRDVVLEDVLKMFGEKAIVELAPQAYTKEVREPAKAGPEESSAKILTKGMKLPTSTPRVYPERFSPKIFTKGKKLNKIAIASTTDLEADKIIHFLIKGKGKLTFPKEGKNIFPLYLFLDKEVLLYAKLRNLKFKKVKEGTDKISEFINELEKTHPEVKQAVVGSWLENESKKK